MVSDEFSDDPSIEQGVSHTKINPGKLYAEVNTFLLTLEESLNSGSPDDWPKVRARMRRYIQKLSSIKPEPDAEIPLEIAAELVFRAYQWGILFDDELLWDFANKLLADGATLEVIGGLNYLCILAKSRSTPNAQCRWSRLRYDLLKIWSLAEQDDHELLDGRLEAISDFIELACAFESPPSAALEWAIAAAKETLEDIHGRATLREDVPDTWLGHVLYLCDALLYAGHTVAVQEIIGQAISAVVVCCDGGPTSIAPNEPSRFRNDAPFLLRLIESRTQGGGT